MLLAFVTALSSAGGPSAVAISDCASWPRQIDSAEQFDDASRAEILAFGKALADSEYLSDDALQRCLKVKSFDHDSVERIRANLWRHLSSNYMSAVSNCANDASFCTRVHDNADFIALASSFKVMAPSPYMSGERRRRRSARHTWMSC